MIDRIKLMTKDVDSDFLLNNFKWRNVPKPDSPHIKCIQSNLNNKSSLYGLRMCLTENLNTNTYSLSIDGSIRKWFLNENDRRDLSYFQFVDCIELLGKKLHLKKGKVWTTFKVTKIEIGLTVLLKSNFKKITRCFVKYRNAKISRKYKNAVAFKFKNYKITFYDKFREMKRKERKTKMNKNISKKFHMLRFELKSKTVSKTAFAKKFENLELIKNNWSEILIVLENYLDTIEYIDLISEENLTEPKTISDFIRMLKFFGMKYITIPKLIKEFGKIDMKNNKSKYLKDLLDIYRSYIPNKNDYIGELKFAFDKKIKRLSNNLHNRYNTTY